MKQNFDKERSLLFIKDFQKNLTVLYHIFNYFIKSRTSIITATTVLSQKLKFAFAIMNKKIMELQESVIIIKKKYMFLCKVLN